MNFKVLEDDVYFGDIGLHQTSGMHARKRRFDLNSELDEEN